ncbi:hypothetical protein [Mycolicibacterium bacteremicum]|uniref:hypothetical protein n=1 Tax=Mycolicibacterium bacteremicum TaxID=564198 RepID=UPI0026EBEC65|nr:hypothetical protein [Mycolicibacterium bacteremicum]
MRFRRSDKSATPDELTTTAEELELETATDPDAALALAEAEAAAAEATAEAARARAEEVRLKSESPAETTEPAAEVEESEAGDTEESDAESVTENDAESVTENAVAEEADAGDTEESHAPAPRSGGTGRVLRWAAATVAMLSIGALVTVSVLMVVHHRGVQDEQRQAAEYAAAAKQSVVTLMSLDFNSVDEDVQRIIDNSTGDFRKEFEGQAKDFATVAKESKVVTEATATAAAVESMTDNDAVVLVTATSTVTNTSGAEQEPRTWRLTVNLTRDGDQIKMSKVEFAP